MKRLIFQVLVTMCLAFTFYTGCETTSPGSMESNTNRIIEPGEYDSHTIQMFNASGENVTFSTQHSADAHGFDDQIAEGDLIAGMIAIELLGDNGWHPANTQPQDQLSAFTDGDGVLASGLTGLLNDFPGSGSPTKRLQYDFSEPVNITRIHVLTGNLGADVRVFSTFTIYYSTDNGTSYDLLDYFQSDPDGTENNGTWQSTLVQVFDDISPTLLTDVTNIRFDFYAVGNIDGLIRDPFDGENPFTGADDGLSAAFVSPLLWEIDVIGESVESVLDSLDDTIGVLPGSVFGSTGRGHRTAMQSRLRGIQEDIDREDYTEAIRKLENLRRHVDGCGSSADGNDWIEDCDAQLEVRALIDSLIALVNSRISS